MEKIHIRDLGVVFFSLLVPLCSAVWPAPREFSSGNTVLWLSPNFEFTGSQNSSIGSFTGFDQIDRYSSDALNRCRQDLFEDDFVPWKFHPRNSDFEPTLSNSSVYIKTVTVSQATSSSNSSSHFSTYGDESYELNISENGDASIAANTTLGVLRALETFKQLFYVLSSREGIYMPFAPVQIKDSPSFKHRGLNLDIARSPYSVDDILHVLDVMSTVKFNQLHIHATDSQSWPLQIPSLPNLANKGAYSRDLQITSDDLDNIQTYGMKRGIEVYIEIDMPGHTASVHHAYPDLITAYNELPDWPTYANEPPSGQLKLNSSAVFNFTDTLFSDLLPRISPYSTKYHTGGDEVNVNAYLLDPTVKSNSTSVLKPLLQSFFDHIHSSVRNAGLTPMVWEEMVLNWNLTFPSDVIVQSWISNASVLGAVEKGHPVIAGAYEYWYLDCGLGAWVDPRPDSNVVAPPYNDYCYPVKNWREIYSYNPLSGIPQNLTHLVLGGEVHLWSEQTDPVVLDRMLWPRAAAAAEVLWTTRAYPNGTERSFMEASPRLAEWRERMVTKGVGAQPVQMVWCLMNPGACSQ
ncbi:MAG: N-acetyl-glucosamine-6-phosphate deacetylase [Cirrosporium novae-zelandiae]|nr:MAG: N-acetyl-glucosamine-6-phosphate deacetylase [Cirrosporium novae-zelandiae]